MGVTEYSFFRERSCSTSVIFVPLPFHMHSFRGSPSLVIACFSLSLLSENEYGFILFRFGLFRFAPFCFVSVCFASLRFVSFRFVPYLFFSCALCLVSGGLPSGWGDDHMRKDSLHLQPRRGVAFAGEQTLRSPGFLQEGIRRVLVRFLFLFVSVFKKNTKHSWWFVLKGDHFYSF